MTIVGVIVLKIIRKLLAINLAINIWSLIYVTDTWPFLFNILDAYKYYSFTFFTIRSSCHHILCHDFINLNI